MNSTRYCRDCGSQVDAAAAVCLSCGKAQQGAVAQAVAEPPVTPNTTPPPNQQASAFCSSCGNSVGASAAVCLNCGAAVQGRSIAAAGSSAKSAGVAALLSFLFVGAGQIYVGDDMGRAIGLLVGGFMLFIIGWFTLILLLPAFGLWIWNIFDAHKRAQAWNLANGFPANT